MQTMRLLAVMALGLSAGEADAPAASASPSATPAHMRRVAGDDRRHAGGPGTNQLHGGRGNDSLFPPSTSAPSSRSRTFSAHRSPTPCAVTHWPTGWPVATATTSSRVPRGPTASKAAAGPTASPGAPATAPTMLTTSTAAQTTTPSPVARTTTPSSPATAARAATAAPASMRRRPARPPPTSP